MKIRNNHLEATLDALRDLSANRLPGAVAFRVMRVKKSVADAFGTVLEARDVLIKAHAGGDKIGPEHENWHAFLPEYNALMTEESECEVEPLDPKEWLDVCEVKPDSLGVLDHVGLLKN